MILCRMGIWNICTTYTINIGCIGIVFFNVINFNIILIILCCSGAEITVQTKDGSTRDVTVTGIDQYGFLMVTSKDGITSSVEPDGNTFDMMQGLIAPKIH